MRLKDILYEPFWRPIGRSDLVAALLGFLLAILVIAVHGACT